MRRMEITSSRLIGALIVAADHNTLCVEGNKIQQWPLKSVVLHDLEASDFWFSFAVSKFSATLEISDFFWESLSA